MATPVTCKFDEDLIKIDGTIDRTRSNMGFFATQGQVTLKWIVWSGRNPRKLIQDSMAILVSCKIDKDLIKSEVAIIRTTFSPVMGKNFVAQGRVTPKWISRSGPKSSSCKILWLSLLPATLTKLW